jgi:Mrp family chromosome partitioning ATPase
VAVTSSARGEGKTLVSAGLAAVAARQAGRPVLVVDLNWYRPTLHDAFGRERGFTVGALTGPGSLRRCVVPSGVANLDLLPAPLPYEHVAHPPANLMEAALAVVREARAQYRMVLVDCPAVFPANRHMMDPVSIVRQVSLVLLVVLAGVTPRQDVKRTATLLGVAGARRVSVVLNQWRNPLA